MSELIMGVGQQKSIRKIISMSDTTLRRHFGIPGRVKGHARALSFEADRPDFDSDFNAFTIRLDASDKEAAGLQKAADALGEICDLNVEDEAVTLRVPANGAAAPEDIKAALEAISNELTLPEIWRLEGDHYRTDPISMEMLFKAMLQYKASDVHLTPGQKPIFRVDNQTHQAEIIGVLSSAQILDVIEQIAPAEHWEEFQKRQQASFRYHQLGLGYARASCFIKSGSPHLTFRYLPEKIPSFDDLAIPKDTMQEMANMHDGLLLIAGMTGSGKSTTSASIIDWINRNRMCHVLTIEDPIEYVHENRKAFVSQRSLGDDVENFAFGVEGALRHDPDVILIGEMRDADTIRAAISAASTGHLVVSTLHSNNASGVVNRIVSFFDPIERDLVRQQLQDSLRCVICQRLIPKKGGGRLPALEMLFNDIKPISDGISAGDTLKIRIGMQQGLSHSMLFEHYIYDMYNKDKSITLEVAKAAAPEASMFDQILMGTYTVPRIL